MGRKRKSLVEKSPFKLRRRKLADGRMSLFLDRSVNGGHEYEFLQLYLLPETSSTAKRQNARTLREAEEILQARTEALFNAKAETELAGSGTGMLLSDWLQTCYNNHEKRGLRDMGSISNVKRALHMFRPDTRLSDIDRQFCLDMIDWFRNTYKHRLTGKPVSARTADTYCQTFRTMLNEAVREGLMDKNPWNRLETIEKIKKPESKREYLTIDEIRSMIATDCEEGLSVLLFYRSSHQRCQKPQMGRHLPRERAGIRFGRDEEDHKAVIHTPVRAGIEMDARKRRKHL